MGPLFQQFHFHAHMRLCKFCI